MNRIYATKRKNANKQALINVLSSKDPCLLYRNIEVSKSNSLSMHQKKLTKSLAKDYGKSNDFNKFILANIDHDYILSIFNEHANKTKSIIHKKIWSSNTKNRISTVVAKRFNHKNYKLACGLEYYCNLYDIVSDYNYKAVIYGLITGLYKIKLTNKSLSSLIRNLYKSDHLYHDGLNSWLHDKLASVLLLKRIVHILSDIDSNCIVATRIIKIVLDDLVAYEGGSNEISFRHNNIANVISIANCNSEPHKIISKLQEVKSFVDIEVKLRELVDGTVINPISNISKVRTSNAQIATDITLYYSLYYSYHEVIDRINQIKKSDVISKPKHINIADDLNVSLYPSNYYDGWLGVNASGVCIDYADRYHLSLIQSCSVNLVVHTDKSVELWIFATKCQAKLDNKIQDVLIINSFQGRLKTRHKKYKSQILNAVSRILNDNISIPILFSEFSFNTFQLSNYAPSKRVNIDLISIPNMRLDFNEHDNFILLQNDVLNVA
jgi:hypothetical protein